MAWWFGRKGAPEPVRALVPAWLGTSGGEGFSRSYEAQFDEVYRNNPVGQRAVRLLSGLLGSLTVYSAKGNEAAAGLITAELIEGMGAALLLFGYAYVQLLTDGVERPAELVLLRSERVSVETDSSGWPIAYKYRAGGKTARFARKDGLDRALVAHVRSLNPRDDHYGMGCLDAAIAAASVHNRASRWNKGLLDNAARPSGALTYAPGDGSSLSGEQFDRLQQELATQFSGSGNAGRPLLLEGGLSWQAMSMTPADMDFVALKEGAARDIALAFGVPPVLVGLPGDATYANAREAGRALYRQTVLPLAGSIVRELSAMLSDWLGPVRIEIDSDAISELAEDRARLWEQATSADFISRDEKRELLGYQREGAGQ
jgi:HK97 family phage portal protein